MPCSVLVRRHDRLCNVCCHISRQSQLARSDIPSCSNRLKKGRQFSTSTPLSSKNPADLHKHAQHVIPGSLTSTINIHRKANQDAKIRPVKTHRPEGVEDARKERRGLFARRSDENRPMTLVSSLSEDFRKRVAEEASKYALFNPKQSRLLMGKRKIVERANAEADSSRDTVLNTVATTDRSTLLRKAKISRNTGTSRAKPTSTSSGYLTREEAEHLAARRKALLQKYEEPQQPIPSEDDWEAQMDIIARTRNAVYRKQEAIKNDDDFKQPHRKQTILEHIGQIVPFTWQPAVRYQPAEPWASASLRDCNDAPMDRLATEIEAFMEWMEPTEAELAARESVFDDMMVIIRDTCPELSAARFGSQTTGLIMPTSDADIRLWRPRCTPLSETTNLNNRDETGPLSRLRARVESNPNYTSVEIVESRYRTLNAVHAATGLQVQVVVSPGSDKSHKLIVDSLAAHPHLKSIFTVIKTALDMRGLSKVYRGGLGSYTVFNMVLAALNMHKVESSDNPHGEQQQPPSAGALLHYFFDFYGRRFNSYAFGLAVSPAALFPKRARPTREELGRQAGSRQFRRAQKDLAKPVHLQHYMLCLQDPADAKNDLGRKSFAFKHVQATMAHFADRYDPKRKSGMSSREFFSRRDCMLRYIVGRCDYLYDDVRTRLDLYGETCVRNPTPL